MNATVMGSARPGNDSGKHHLPPSPICFSMELRLSCCVHTAGDATVPQNGVGMTAQCDSVLATARDMALALMALVGASPAMEV